jgi:hypothetical protein
VVPTDLVVGKVERDHCAARTPVILDSEFAALYGATVSVLNQAVKRNIQRFPADFAFQLTRDAPRPSR